MQKKAVFIFGAGAVLDWGGPLTLCKRKAYERIPEHDTGEIYNRPCCLTHLLLVTGFYTATGERITQRIYDRLKQDDPNAYVNFETILNIVEDLYAYWAARTDNEKNNLYDLIDVNEDLSELHHFTTTSSAHHYSLEVPGFTMLDGAEMIHNDIDPHVKYYELLINELLSGIVGHISKYAYASPTHQQFAQDVNSKVTENFRSWMRSFVESGHTLRLYTLNYDDIFKRITESENVTVFDGFFPGHQPDNYQAEPNLKRIVTDTDTHCHYNLHGSWYWEVDEYNENQLQSYRYRKSMPGVINGSAASIVLEKGKRILLTNIISGYQKVQKTATSPFRQFFQHLTTIVLKQATYI
ncbi:hypothetical protein ACQ86K_01200 [Mucilaginibacter sp. P19]|uniref:hypothetical protein n=1 Tax=Mucilaginibacter sp. P19 TaxID=3423947 RepID=UPI003D66DDEE